MFEQALTSQLPTKDRNATLTQPTQGDGASGFRCGASSGVVPRRDHGSSAETNVEEQEKSHVMKWRMTRASPQNWVIPASGRSGLTTDGADSQGRRSRLHGQSRVITKRFDVLAIPWKRDTYVK